MHARSAVLALTLVLSSLAAVAEVHRDDRGGVTYDIPSWWKWEQREEGVVMATEDGSLVVMVWTPKTDDLRQALQSLEKDLERAIQQAKPDGKPTAGSLNGMETLSVSGRGRVAGAPAEYSVMIVGAKRPVIVLAFAETGKYEKHTEELKGFLNTIKRIR